MERSRFVFLVVMPSGKSMHLPSPIRPHTMTDNDGGWEPLDVGSQVKLGGIDALLVEALP